MGTNDKEPTEVKYNNSLCGSAAFSETGLLITVFISLVQNYIKLVLETVVISSRIYGLLTGPEQLLSY